MEYNKFLIAIISAIILYVIFLMISDFTVLTSKINNFRIEFLPAILLLVPCGWLPLYLRWNLLLRNSNVKIPFRENLAIYFAGYAFGITPGRVGELIKSQLLKTKFDISRTKTAPLIIVERLYDLIGAVMASLLSIWLLQTSSYIIIAFFMAIILVFALISSRSIFDKSLSLFAKFKYISKLIEPLSESYDVVRTSTRGKVAIISSLLSVAHWLIISLAVYFVIVSFGIDTVNYPSVVSTYSSSLILGAVTLIPGGIGVAEGSLVGLFSLQGIEVSVALALVVLIRIFTLWYTVAVGFIALKLSGGLSNSSKAR